jgi:hypothetical protein
VFTARYVLSLYIKQIRFCFKGIIHLKVAFPESQSSLNIRANKIRIALSQHYVTFIFVLTSSIFKFREV